jgi:hypothetical protein
MTDAQRLTRDVDAALAALPRVLWPLLVPAARLVQATQWSGVSEDGRPACPDCRRMASYGSHPCSCPTRRVLKRLGAYLA